jgi:hypothetical protein
MKAKSAHEPQAEVMNAEEVWDDAQRIAAALRRNLSKAEPVVQLRIPLSAYLSALEDLSREDLLLLRQQIEQRLAA